MRQQLDLGGTIGQTVSYNGTAPGPPYLVLVGGDLAVTVRNGL